MKKQSKESGLKLTLKEMAVIIELGGYSILIYLCQKYLFSDHSWFLVSLPVFVFIWAVAVNYILNKDNVYMLEATMKGEEFHDMINNETKLSLTTRLRLIVMDREFYNSLDHIGDIHNPLWNTSRTIKFCNYYDDSNKIAYHSEYPQLQNVNFYALPILWLKLKELVPKLMRENLMLTWLGDIKVGHELKLLGKEYKYRIKAIAESVAKDPFQLPKDLDELAEYSKNIKSHTPDEKPQENAPETTEEANND